MQRSPVGILFLACLANSKDAIMFVCGVEGRGLRQELVMLQVRSEKSKDELYLEPNLSIIFRKSYSECAGSQ